MRAKTEQNRRDGVAFAAGGLIFGVGLAAVLGLMPALADYSYAILWWGLLIVVDRWNERRRGLSIWRGRMRHFLLITLPVSVLFWLLFELMNLPAPQWLYKGSIDNLHAQVLFGFVSFGTVLPIMAESYWLFGGAFCLPEFLPRRFREWRTAAIVAGCAVASIPFFNHIFWFNQGIWLAPALVLLPFVDLRACAKNEPFWRPLVLSALLAGVVWEGLNFWSRTHWEYLILPRAPHLFQMPVAGYLGFIPFALTAMIVYEEQLRLRARVLTSIILYAVAFAGLYVLTTIYIQRGLWLLR